MQNENQRIQVFVRCRPASDDEIRIIQCFPDKKKVMLNDKRGTCRTRTYYMEGVFGERSQQKEVYDKVLKPRVKETIEGYNCTVFAYGQTGTGKTFTMLGELSDPKRYRWSDDPCAGMIPRALFEIFSQLKSTQRECDAGSEFAVRISFLEIYNEVLKDLLYEGNDPPKLQVYDCQEHKGNVKVKGLSEVSVRTPEEAWTLLEKGIQIRQTAATNVNLHSSRSHSVFTIQTTIRETLIDGKHRMVFGKLHLVDLAGSECIGRSGATDMRAREAGKINTSLLTLNRVIAALVNRGSHVPFRESKLTRLLQDSLGGRTKTSIIATISPARECIEETISTLDYANTARDVTNRPEINMKVDNQGLLRDYEHEISKLREDLSTTREKNGIYIKEERYQEMIHQIDLLESKCMAKNEYIDELKSEMTQLKRNLRDEKLISETYQNSELNLRQQAQQIFHLLEDTVDKISTLRQGLTVAMDRDSSHYQALCSSRDNQMEYLQNVFHSIHQSQLAGETTMKSAQESMDCDNARVAQILATFSNNLQMLWNNLLGKTNELVPNYNAIQEEMKNLLSSLQQQMEFHFSKQMKTFDEQAELMNKFHGEMSTNLTSSTVEVNKLIADLSVYCVQFKENIKEFTESLSSAVDNNKKDFETNHEVMNSLTTSLSDSSWYTNARTEQQKIREQITSALQNVQLALQEEASLSQKLDQTHSEWVKRHHSGMLQCGQSYAHVHNNFCEIVRDCLASNESKQNNTIDHFIVNSEKLNNQIQEQNIKIDCLIKDHVEEELNCVEVEKESITIFNNQQSSSCQQTHNLLNKLYELVEDNRSNLCETVEVNKEDCNKSINDISSEVFYIQRMANTHLHALAEQFVSGHCEEKTCLTKAVEHVDNLVLQCYQEPSLKECLKSVGYEPPRSENRDYLAEVPSLVNTNSKLREEILADFYDQQARKRQYFNVNEDDDEIGEIESIMDDVSVQNENCPPESKKSRSIMME